MRDSVARCVKREAEQDGAQPGTDQSPAGRTGGDVHGDDHEAEPKGSGFAARRPSETAFTLLTTGERTRGRGDFMKASLVGINHVALEVGDIEEALDFYGRIFELKLRGRAGRMAFVDMGDQFIALAGGRRQPPDDHRHFGLVVDDKQRALAAAREAGAEIRGNDFRDPWGNNVQVVGYEDVQFTKTPAILDAMGLELDKTEKAREEIRQKLGPDAAS